jgi:hypothetical protein
MSEIGQALQSGDLPAAQQPYHRWSVGAAPASLKGRTKKRESSQQF